MDCELSDKHAHIELDPVTSFSCWDPNLGVFSKDELGQDTQAMMRMCIEMETYSIPMAATLNSLKQFDKGRFEPWCGLWSGDG